jgi:hypothetical protein
MLPRIICLTTVCISAPQDTEYMIGCLLHLQDMKHAKSASSTSLLSKAVTVVSEQYTSPNRQDCSSVRSVHADALFIQASFPLVSSRATPTGPLSQLPVDVVGQCTEACMCWPCRKLKVIGLELHKHSSYPTRSLSCKFCIRTSPFLPV